LKKKKKIILKKKKIVYSKRNIIKKMGNSYCLNRKESGDKKKDFGEKINDLYINEKGDFEEDKFQLAI
jgi:hypothetical protein